MRIPWERRGHWEACLERRRREARGGCMERRVLWRPLPGRPDADARLGCLIPCLLPLRDGLGSSPAMGPVRRKMEATPFSGEILSLEEALPLKERKKKISMEGRKWKCVM